MGITDFTNFNRFLEKVVRIQSDIVFIFISDGEHNATSTELYLASLRGCLNNLKGQLIQRRASKLRFDMIVINSGANFPEDFFKGFKFVVEKLIGGRLKTVKLSEVDNTLTDFPPKSPEEDPLDQLYTLVAARDMVDNREEIDAYMSQLKAQSLASLSVVIDSIMQGKPRVLIHEFVDRFKNELETNLKLVIDSTKTMQIACKILRGARVSETHYSVKGLVEELGKLKLDELDNEFDQNQVAELIASIMSEGVIALAVYTVKITAARDGNTVIMEMRDYLNLSPEEKKKFLAVLPHKTFFEMPMDSVLCALYGMEPTLKNYRRILSKFLLKLITFNQTGKVSDDLVSQQLELMFAIMESSAPFTHVELSEYADAIRSDLKKKPEDPQKFELNDSHIMTLLVYVLVKRKMITTEEIRPIYTAFMGNPKLSGPDAVHNARFSFPGIFNLIKSMNEFDVWASNMRAVRRRLEINSGAYADIEAFFAVSGIKNVFEFEHFIKKIYWAGTKQGLPTVKGIVEQVGPKIINGVLGLLDPNYVRKDFEYDPGVLLNALFDTTNPLWEGFFSNKEECPATSSFSEYQGLAEIAAEKMKSIHRYKEPMNVDGYLRPNTRKLDTCPSCGMVVGKYGMKTLTKSMKGIHHHDKCSIPGIMLFYQACSLIPDVDVFKFVELCAPRYSEIHSHLKLFEVDEELKAEFLDAAHYYIGAFKCQKIDIDRVISKPNFTIKEAIGIWNLERPSAKP
jgi:hypothetical protein